MAILISALTSAGTLILGAGLAYWATTHTETTRWDRLQQSRWDARLLEACVEFQTAVKDEFLVCLRIGAGRGLGDMGAAVSIDVETGHKLFDEALSRRTIAWEALLLLGDDKSQHTAGKWDAEVRDLYRYVTLPSEVSGTEFTTRALDVRKARREFYLASRSALGISREFLADDAEQLRGETAAEVDPG